MAKLNKPNWLIWDKILVILGPTAVGKTDLAVKLAKKFGGELIAADSRQVYCGLDIGTGKYSPGDKFKKFSGKWLLNDVAILGYDLIEPGKQFTAADFAKFFWKTVPKIWAKNKLPILVGGTGFYIKAALSGFETLGIPLNLKLRKELGKFSVAKLFQKLLKIDPKKANSLFPSDKRNSRRLIRAIEVATYLKNHPQFVLMYPYIGKSEIDVLKIGLNCPRKVLYYRIDQRVDERIELGLIDEVKKLLKKGIKADRLKEFGLEYRFLTQFVLVELKKEEAISELKFAIHDFSRRQLTWFKKEKDIFWFDITDKNYYQEVEKMVGKWYSYQIKN